MFLVHFGLVTLVLALIMLPRFFAIHFNSDDNASVGHEEYDYR